MRKITAKEICSFKEYLILEEKSKNTTRIYTVETGEVNRRQIQKLALLRC